MITTAVFRLVVPHARPFGGDFELEILRMRGFSSRFLDNQPENCCTMFIQLSEFNLHMDNQLAKHCSISTLSFHSPFNLPASPLSIPLIRYKDCRLVEGV